MGTGLLSGVAPVRRALRLDQVEALHADYLNSNHWFLREEIERVNGYVMRFQPTPG